jgi:hypothetical protein
VGTSASLDVVAE